MFCATTRKWYVLTGVSPVTGMLTEVSRLPLIVVAGVAVQALVAHGDGPYSTHAVPAVPLALATPFSIATVAPTLVAGPVVTVGDAAQVDRSMVVELKFVPNALAPKR